MKGHTLTFTTRSNIKKQALHGTSAPSETEDEEIRDGYP